MLSDDRRRRHPPPRPARVHRRAPARLPRAGARAGRLEPPVVGGGGQSAGRRRRHVRPRLVGVRPDGARRRRRRSLHRRAGSARLLGGRGHRCKNVQIKIKKR